MPKQSKVDISERLAAFEQHVNENLSDVQRQLNDLLKFQDRSKENFLEVERKLVEVDRTLESKEISHVQMKDPSVSDAKLESMRSHLEEKIKALEDVLMLLEVEVVKAKERGLATTTTGITPRMPSALEDRVKSLEENFRTLEKLKLNVPIELVQHEPRLKSIESNVLALQKNLRQEVARLETASTGSAPTEQSTERFIVKLREEMDELRQEIEKAELLKIEITTKERSFATRQDLDAFETRIRDDVKKIHDLTDRVSAAEKSLDNHLVNIEDKIAGATKSLKHETQAHLRAFDDKVADLESALRKELEAHNRTFDSKLSDLETGLNEELEKHRRTNDSTIIDMEERVAKVAAEAATEEATKAVGSIMAAHKNDVDITLQRISSLERDLESKATAIVSKELAAFSEAVDKKFPDIVTKMDFADWSHAVADRVRLIEAPDMNPLASRMDNLEDRLDELSGMIRQILGRMPLVIE